MDCSCNLGPLFPLQILTFLLQNQKDKIRRAEAGMPEMHLDGPNVRWLQSYHEAESNEKAGVLSAAFVLFVTPLIFIISYTATAPGDQLQRRCGGESVYSPVSPPCRRFGGHHARPQLLLLGTRRTRVLFHVQSREACHRCPKLGLSRLSAGRVQHNRRWSTHQQRALHHPSVQPVAE